MSKFSKAEKVRAVQLVETGETIGRVSRLTGISRKVIRNALAFCQSYDFEDPLSWRKVSLRMI